MKHIQLYEDGGLRSFLLVMERGDEAVAKILEFANAFDVTAASLTAIGACREVTLGYFDAELVDYRWQTFAEQLEIASFIGDIAMDEGKPALHAHVVLGRADFSAIAGHLKELDVSPTLEVVLTEAPAHLRKRIDARTGLALIAPDISTEPA